eukprot:1020247-Pyramimonas_sp.AAC.1
MANGFSVVPGLVRRSRRLADRSGLPAQETVSRVSHCQTGARPARDRGSRGGAAARACPGGTRCRALPA